MDVVVDGTLESCLAHCGLRLPLSPAGSLRHRSESITRSCSRYRVRGCAEGSSSKRTTEGTGGVVRQAFGGRLSAMGLFSDPVLRD